MKSSDLVRILNPQSSSLRSALFVALLVCSLAGSSLAAAADVAQAAGLTLQAGDHVCFIGNTLAERMQHDGWVETLIQSRFPQHQLVFRNLGFSGDELTLRLRSSNFGSPDDHLTFNRADVIFAFFGYNESFGGEEGLAKFKSDLEGFVRGTLGKQYNGKSAPRLVLFSPIAHEDLGDPNLPDGSENNDRLAMYTAAMAEVAAANDVPFVDLFGPTRKLYEQSSKPLTINGIHLNHEGNRLVAEVIDQSLFADQRVRREPQTLEKLRQAVLDKNFYPGLFMNLGILEPPRASKRL